MSEEIYKRLLLETNLKEYVKLIEILSLNEGIPISQIIKGLNLNKRTYSRIKKLQSLGLVNITKSPTKVFLKEI